MASSKRVELRSTQVPPPPPVCDLHGSATAEKDEDPTDAPPVKTKIPLAVLPAGKEVGLKFQVPVDGNEELQCVKQVSIGKKAKLKFVRKVQAAEKLLTVGVGL